MGINYLPEKKKDVLSGPLHTTRWCAVMTTKNVLQTRGDSEHWI